MKRPQFSSRWLLVGLLALGSSFHPAAAESTKPNVIVILADDIGWGDAGCYGATKIKTPNIDRMARDGQRFVNGHASAAVCTPTRYSLITGQYSWRREAAGLNKGVANSESPLLIPTTMTTAPGLLRDAGYRTAVIGKWHLGLSSAKPDFNLEIRPGPLEIGFHQFFGIPATNDRIPTVFMRDHRVVGLTPDDPLYFSFDKATAKAEGMSSWSAGRNRIGWAKGGKSAWWEDTQIADTLNRESIRFIEENKDKPFFLYFAPHNVHAPAIPHPRFVGTSGLGNRADMLQEFDSSIGELFKTLDLHNLTRNTLIIYSSDNGAYLNDEQGHRPTGPYRGKKSQLWEGGHRVPFIVHWPARIQPGVSEDLVSTIDIPFTITAAAGASVPENALPDSYNLLPSLLGKENAPKRDHLIVMSGMGDLAVRSGDWKYMPNLAVADGWYGSPKKGKASSKGPALYNLKSDPGENQNLIKQKPKMAERLAAMLEKAKTNPVTRPR